MRPHEWVFLFMFSLGLGILLTSIYYALACVVLKLTERKDDDD